MIMDNYQIPSAQPQVNQPAIGPRPMVQQVQVVPKSKNNIDLIKTIVIVILSLEISPFPHPVKSPVAQSPTINAAIFLFIPILHSYIKIK